MPSRCRSLLLRKANAKTAFWKRRFDEDPATPDIAPRSPGMPHDKVTTVQSPLNYRLLYRLSKRNCATVDETNGTRSVMFRSGRFAHINIMLPTGHGQSAFQGQEWKP